MTNNVVYIVELSYKLKDGSIKSVIDMEFYWKELAESYIKAKSTRPAFKNCKFHIITKKI